MRGRIMVVVVVKSVNTICSRFMVWFVVFVASLKTQYLVALWLSLLLLWSVSKQNLWSYYCLVCRTLSSVSKPNVLSYYAWVCHCCRPSVNTI
jgi:hypothetical protein